MSDASVTVQAGANIAFIKYWGNRGSGANLPLNPSISMTLAECVTRSTVAALPDAGADEIRLDGRAVSAESARRITAFLDVVRDLAGKSERLVVESENAFPTGCGIASSASGFAALALAASRVLGMSPDGRELSRIARRGSGSAARSVFGGFVELVAGETDEQACAEQLAPESDWPELRDLVAVVSDEEKAVSSAEGHRLAQSSEMLQCRLRGVTQRAERVRRAIVEHDLAALGEAAEADALNMHAVMMTSSPPLLYWQPGTLQAIALVRGLREEGLPAWFTIDAGPNVHILTEEQHLDAIESRISGQFGWRTICDRAGPAVRVVERGAQ